MKRSPKLRYPKNFPEHLKARGPVLTQQQSLARILLLADQFFYAVDAYKLIWGDGSSEPRGKLLGESLIARALKEINIARRAHSEAASD